VSGGVAACSVCGIRTAKYYRASSGERLCERCLFGLLERAVARVLGKAEAKENSSFVVPITSYSPSRSLLAARVLAQVERRFKSRIYVLVPTFYKGLGEDILKGVPQAAKALWAEVTPPPPPEANLTACIRYDRAWAAAAARLLGADFIVMPTARTSSTIIALDSLMSDGGLGLTEAAELLDLGGLRSVNAFFYVEDEAVAAMEFLEGVAEISPACRAYVSVKGVYESVAGRPEIDHSSADVIEGLLSAAPYKRCRVCGGASDGEVCSYCKLMRLEGLQVRLL
jgi:hypothetical protein